MQFPDSPHTRLTDQIMVAIRDHIQRDPPPQENHHFNRAYEKVHAILMAQNPGKQGQPVRAAHQPPNLLETDAWEAMHRDHGPKTVEDAGHPEGTWKRFCCPCGAKHTTVTGTPASRPPGW